MEVSIIVPVYNAEHLLPKCINSILSQTLTDFELILVNDGSTDKSGEICDAYEKLDDRIKVIHKENAGPSSSRNAGMEIAVGNYIGFVDSDDYINRSMYQTLYDNAFLYDSDITVCDFLYIDEGHSCDTTKFNQDYKVQQFTGKEVLNKIYVSKPNYTTFVVCWNKLYKRCLFDNVKFDGSNLYDDETVAHKIYYQSPRITYVQTTLYYYVKRLGSIIHSPFHIKRFDRVYALKEREIFFRKKKEFDLHQKALTHYMEVFFWYYYQAKNELTGIDKELNSLKHTFDRSLLFLLKHNNIVWKRKLLLVSFSVSPSLFKWIQDIRSKKNA